MTTRKRPEQLRSHRWLGVDDLRSFGHRARLRQGRLRRDRFPRQAGDRDRQYLERHQFLPHASARPRRGREARRASGRRFPGRIAGDVAVGTLRQTVDHALSQFAGDGDGRAVAQPSDRWRSADGGLRQDHAGFGDGRDQHGHPRDLCAGRAAAARQLAWPGARFRLRRVEILG